MMSSFKDLEDLDIASWLDWRGVDYKRTTGSHGIQLNIKECPVCGNSNWKVYLNEETGLGNCFHGDCEAKFNKYKFIKASLGATSASAVFQDLDEYLDDNGWSNYQPKTAEKTIQPSEVNLTNFISLPVENKNLSYLINRGISNEATRYFELGFSQYGKFMYKSPDGHETYNDFSMRVIIPVRELDGRVVTFQGRDITGLSKKKYMFPAGLKSTGAILYNGHHAIGVKSIVLCEGVFDVISVWQAFQEDGELAKVVPVGTFGKHLSSGDKDSQLGKLLDLKDFGLTDITFMWDGEAQALKDACKAALELKRYGFNVRVARLPGKDPNELPKEVVRKAYKDAFGIDTHNVASLLLSLR